MKTTLLATSALLLVTSTAFADKSAVVENYANISEAKFEDSLITAKALQVAGGILA